MSLIKDLRDALYERVLDIDISEVWEDGWTWKGKYPPKQKEYPAFWVEPTSDGPQITIDSCSAETPFRYWVSITESYEDAPSGEDLSIELADLVRSSLLSAVKSGEPIGSGAFDGSLTGQWGFDDRLGERVYRIEVTIRATEELDP